MLSDVSDHQQMLGTYLQLCTLMSSGKADPPQVDQTWVHVPSILGPSWDLSCWSRAIGCSVWCFFYGLAQGLSVDPQFFEQPDGGCCKETPAADLHRANFCFPAPLVCLKCHVCILQPILLVDFINIILPGYCQFYEVDDMQCWTRVSGQVLGWQLQYVMGL